MILFYHKAGAMMRLHRTFFMLGTHMGYGGFMYETSTPYIFAHIHFNRGQK